MMKLDFPEGAIAVGLFMFVLGFALAVEGCTSQVVTDPRALQLEVTAAAYDVWHERYLTTMPECEERREAIRWETAGEDVFGVPGLSNKGAFTKLEDGSPVIVFREGVERTEAQERELMAHELCHWMLHCSRRWAGGDPAHVDGLVWPLWLPEIAERSYER